MLFKLYNITNAHHNKGKHICNREKTNTKKLVCPRVKFSSDLMTWLAHAYNTKKKMFYDFNGREVFSLSFDNC